MSRRATADVASERSRKGRSFKTPQRPSKLDLYEDAHFRVIDLDVRSRQSLAPLVAAWPSSYLPMTEVDPPQWLILNSGEENAEDAAKELLRRIARLKGDALRCWARAHQKVFDIGVDAPGPGCRAFEEVRLTPKTLRRIGEAGATIQITVYGPAPLTPPRRGRLGG